MSPGPDFSKEQSMCSHTQLCVVESCYTFTPALVLATQRLHDHLSSFASHALPLREADPVLKLLAFCGVSSTINPQYKALLGLYVACQLSM